MTRNWSILYTILLLWIFAVGFAIIIPNVLPVEMQALQSIYNDANGMYWTWSDNQAYYGIPWCFNTTMQKDPSNSNCTANPCAAPKWQGITCNGYNESQYFANGSIPIAPVENAPYSNITAIYLELFNLTGSLSFAIGNLTHLNSLEVSGNVLRGTIPRSVGNLTKLVRFNVDDNRMTGRLPVELANCRYMVELQLGSNYFTGPLTGEIFANMEYLVEINVGGNYLTGRIPEELYNLKYLNSLYFAFNNFTGSISPAIGSLKYLEFVSYSNTLINGSIPDSIGNLVNLEYLDIMFTEVTGTIPAGVCNFSVYFSQLALYSNQLIGSIPPCVFTSMHQLVTIELYDNLLTGTLPMHLVGVPKLRELLIYNNLLSGPLPEGLFSLPVLAKAELYGNAFTGTIPSTFIDSHFPGSLEILTMGRNYLTGEVPAVFKNLTIIEAIAVQNNLLTSISPQFMSWNLLSFNISSNLVTGPLPVTLMTDATPISLLDILDLSNNLYTGTIPAVYGESYQLDYLVLSYNMLSGSLPFNQNITNQYQSLTTLIINNNQLTGQIPIQLFQRNRLQVLVASINCFSGSIPFEICSAIQLRSVILDGLGTASSCQNRFFSSQVASNVQSYQMRSPFQGGIPGCMLALPVLKSLHLSGNGLTGQIDGSASLNTSFQTLVLSHNALTGSIPDSIQTQRWQQLDLSFNKLNGVISPNMPSLYSNASLSLEVNRLSSAVPSSLYNAESISILNGNMFQCDLEQQDLPKHDSDVDIYSCGSNSFDFSAYAFTAFSVAILLGLLVFFVLLKIGPAARTIVVQRASNIVSQLYQYCTTLGSLESLLQFRGVTENCTDVLQLRGVISNFKSVYLITVMWQLCVLLPVYLVLTYYFGTYTKEYAYTASIAFIQGRDATVIMLVVLSAEVTALTRLFRSRPPVVLGTEGSERISHEKEIQMNVMSDANGSGPRLLSESTTEDNAPSRVYGSALRRLLLVAVVLFNCVIVATVNVAFLYIITNYSNEVASVAFMAMALFKWLWTEVAVIALLEMAGRLDQTKVLQSRSIFGWTLMSLFNNIVIPCFAIAASNSNCFKYALQTPPSVTGSYTYTAALLFEGTFESLTILSNVDFVPPFIYSYQCSSELVASYATAFVYLFLLSGVAGPIVQFGMVGVHGWCGESSRLQAVIEGLLPQMLLIPLTKQSYYAPQKVCRESISWLFRKRILFCRETFLVSHINGFAVLLTFGAVFPLLGVIICISMVCQLYSTQLKLGYFVSYAISEARLNGHLKQLKADCQCTPQLLRSANVAGWVLVCLACLFYALFLVDSANGDGDLTWVPALMACLPLVIAAYIGLFKAYRNHSSNLSVLESTTVVDASSVKLQKDNHELCGKITTTGVEDTVSPMF